MTRSPALLALIALASSPAAAQPAPAAPAPAAPRAAAPSGASAALGLRPTAQPRVIKLDDAFALAVQQSFDLRIAETQLDEARARVRQAWSAILPQVSVGGGYTYNFPEQKFAFGDERQFQQQALLFNSIADLTAASAAQIPDATQQRAALERAEELRATARELERTKVTEVQIQPTHAFDGQVQLQVPLFNGRALPLLQNAYAGVDITRIATQQARAQIVYGVARAYYQAFAAERIATIAERQIESARKHRELAAQRVEAGVLTPLALQRAELDVARAEQQHKAAAGGVRLAKAALGAMLGVVEDFALAEPPPLPPVERGVAIESLVERAFAARDDLRMQREALGVADRTRTDAWMRYLPVFALTASGRGTSNTEGLVSQPFSGAVGVQASIPLYDGGYAGGAIDEANAKVRAEILRVRQLEQVIEREVRGAVDDVALKRDALETSTRVSSLAEAQKAQADDLFAAGAATSLDVADASLGAFSAAVDAERARFDLESARLGLAFAIGELRPVDAATQPAPLSDEEVQRAREFIGEDGAASGAASGAAGPVGPVGTVGAVGTVGTVGAVGGPVGALGTAGAQQ